MGKLANLYPSDAWQAALCDEVMEAVEDIGSTLGQRLKTHMTWKPIPDSAKSLLEGVEFGMTDGATMCWCSISQQQIDKWAGHSGKIDRRIAFELFRKHESEIYAVAARILDEFPRLQGIVTEVLDGFTVTVWLASGDPLKALTLITDEPSASAQAAIDLVRELAKARGIPAEQIDLRFRLAHDAAPKNKPTN